MKRTSRRRRHRKEKFQVDFADITNAIAIALFGLTFLSLLYTSASAGRLYESAQQIQDVFDRKSEITKELWQSLPGLASPNEKGNLRLQVEFPSDSISLDEQSRNALKDVAFQIVDILSKHGHVIESITIEGRTCPTASTYASPWAWEVASRRAGTVMEILEHHEPKLRDPEFAKKLRVSARPFELDDEGDAYGIGAGWLCERYRRVDIIIEMKDDWLLADIRRSLGQP